MAFFFDPVIVLDELGYISIDGVGGGRFLFTIVELHFVFGLYQTITWCFNFSFSGQ